MSPLENNAGGPRAALLAHARDRIRLSVRDAKDGPHAVRRLGGCEQACTLLTLASLDTDGDGRLRESEYERYKEVGAQLVESTKNFHLNAGVVAALVLSVVFPFAYEENETLTSLAEALTAEPWSYVRIADLTSFLGIQLAVSTSFLTVLISSRLYTQISFWMPNLDSQLWFINESAAATSYLEAAKNFTLFATLLSLSLETAVTATFFDALAYAPLCVLALSYVYFELTLSAKCRMRLGRDLQRLDLGLGGESPSA